MIAYAKAHPGKLSYGSGGVGAITHITPEMFKMREGLDILHVPYRGVAPAMNDLLAGQVQIIFPNVTSQVVSLHRPGKLRLLAVNAPTRLEAAPDIPTAAEAGLPLLASMYEAGLEVGGDDLDRLSDELAALQQMWASTIDPLATIAFSALGHRGEAPLIYDLVFHRAELLRLAIRVARAIDGCVRID